MNREILHEDKKVDAYWLPEPGVLHVAYKGELLPESTLIAYKLGGDLLAKYGNDGSRYRGVIGDFRQVVKFPNSNIVITRGQSQKVNTEYDLSRLAISLLVTNLLQERFVKMTNEVSGTTYRSKIVHTFKDALDFIETYRKTFENFSEGTQETTEE